MPSWVYTETGSVEILIWLLLPGKKERNSERVEIYQKSVKEMPICSLHFDTGKWIVLLNKYSLTFHSLRP